MNNQLYFAKTQVQARLPSKRLEDAGYDLYACFKEPALIIEPHQTVLVPTGIATAFVSDYVMVLKERGSTGSKGMAQRAGVIDSGYRQEIFIPLTNTNKQTLVIAKQPADYDSAVYVVYPYDKAIAQALVLLLPTMTVSELNWEELKLIDSERGLGNLGSSGK